MIVSPNYQLHHRSWAIFWKKVWSCKQFQHIRCNFMKCITIRKLYNRAVANYLPAFGLFQFSLVTLSACESIFILGLLLLFNSSIWESHSCLYIIRSYKLLSLVGTIMELKIMPWDGLLETCLLRLGTTHGGTGPVNVSTHSDWVRYRGLQSTPLLSKLTKMFWRDEVSSSTANLKPNSHLNI